MATAISIVYGAIVDLLDAKCGEAALSFEVCLTRSEGIWRLHVHDDYGPFYIRVKHRDENELLDLVEWVVVPRINTYVKMAKGKGV